MVFFPFYEFHNRNGGAYPAAQQGTGYAVAPAPAAATYGAQRYDQAAYQAAATQGTYPSK